MRDQEERIVLRDARVGIPAALDRLDACWRSAGLGPEAVLDLRLIAEELLTNIAKYAFDAEAGPVELRLSISGASAVLELRDGGRAFDPLAEPAADLQSPAETRAPGRLGLILVRALVDEATYRRDGATNLLRIVKHRCRP